MDVSDSETNAYYSLDNQEDSCEVDCSVEASQLHRVEAQWMYTQPKSFVRGGLEENEMFNTTTMCSQTQHLLVASSH